MNIGLGFVDSWGFWIGLLLGICVGEGLAFSAFKMAAVVADKPEHETYNPDL